MLLRGKRNGRGRGFIFFGTRSTAAAAAATCSKGDVSAAAVEEKPSFSYTKICCRNNIDRTIQTTRSKQNTRPNHRVVVVFLWSRCMALVINDEVSASIVRVYFSQLSERKERIHPLVYRPQRNRWCIMSTTAADRRSISRDFLVSHRLTLGGLTRDSIRTKL